VVSESTIIPKSSYIIVALGDMSHGWIIESMGHFEESDASCQIMYGLDALVATNESHVNMLY